MAVGEVSRGFAAAGGSVLRTLLVAALLCSSLVVIDSGGAGAAGYSPRRVELPSSGSADIEVSERHANMVAEARVLEGSAAEVEGGDGPEPFVDDGSAFYPNDPDPVVVPVDRLPSPVPMPEAVGPSEVEWTPEPYDSALVDDPADLVVLGEVESERSRFGRMEQLADGSQLLTLSTEPLHFEDAGGAWVPIDLTVTERDGVLTGGANEYMTSFLPFGAGGVRVEGHDRAVSFSPLGAAPVAPVLEPDGQSVRYVEAFPGVDIVYRLRGGGLQEMIELKGPEARTEFEFEFEGARFEAGEAGLVEVGRSDAAALRIGAPESFTSEGRSIGMGRHVLDVEISARSTVVRLGLDAAVVDGVERSEFPVVIDPDLMWGADMGHSYLYNSANGSISSSFNDGWIRTGNPVIAGSPNHRWRSVLRFNLAAEGLSSMTNVYGAWIRTNVVDGAAGGWRYQAFYWANEWGPHHGVGPRRLNLWQKSPSGLHAPYRNSWDTSPTNPHDRAVYHHYPINAGWSDWIPSGYAALFYNLMTRSAQVPALLVLGEEPAGVYTYKRYSAELKLLVNRPFSVFPAQRALTSTTVPGGRSVIWGLSGAPTDPDGDPINYRHHLQWKDGSTWSYDPDCLPNLTTSVTQNCILSEVYLGREFRYWSTAYEMRDGSTSWDYQYPDGNWDWHHTNTVTASLAKLPNGQPWWPTLSSPANGSLLGAGLTPTLTANAVTDPDGDQVYYRFTACNAPSGGVCWSSGWITPTHWTVPAGLLRWGDTARWQVEVADAEKIALGEIGRASDVWTFKLGRTVQTHPALGGGFNPFSTDVVGVDPANGNFRYPMTDVSVPAVAMPLEITRTYNSLNHNVAGPFGNGWATSIGVKLEVETNIGATVVWPDGRRHFHGLNPGGAYATALGSGNVLTNDGANFVLTEPSGSVYRFDSTGQLYEMVTKDGKKIAVTYPNGTHKLTDVASGRSLTMTYSGALVTQVATDSVATHDGPLVWKYYYSSNRLTHVCNPNNNAIDGECTVFTYDDNGRLSKVVEPLGSTDAEISYFIVGDYSGRVSSRKDGLGKTWEFAYSATSVVPPAGIGGGAIAVKRTTVTNPRPVQGGDADFNKMIYDYDSYGRLKHSDDLHGGRRWYMHDANGFVVQVRDELGHIEQFVNNARGLVTQRTDPGNGVWTYTYDSNGNELTATQPSAGGATATTTSTYSTAGLKLSETDPNNNTVYWTYTTASEPAYPPGSGTAPAGLVKTFQDANGNVTTYSYSAAGDLRRRVDPGPNGLVVEFDYDAIGRVVAERTIVDGVTRTTTVAYDKLSRPTRREEPTVVNQVSGQSHALVTEWVYDKNSNALTVTESDLFGHDQSRVTTNTYDFNDRLVTTTNPAGGVTTTGYDEVGNTTTVTDPLGRILRTSYDFAQRPVKLEIVNYVDPSGQMTNGTITLTSTTYDAAGRVTQQTDALGNATAFTYDSRGNELTRTLLNYQPRTGAAFGFVLRQAGYDARNRATFEQTAHGQRRVDYTYDQGGRVTKETIKADVAGHVTSHRVVDYTYDPNGNVTVRKVSQAGRTDEVRYTYDQANLVTKETVEAGATDLDTLFERNHAGVVTKLTDPAGVETLSFYDNLDRPWKTQRANVTAEAYGSAPAASTPITTTGYDTWGNLTHTVDAAGATTTTAFDRLDRRTSITHPSYTPPAAGGAITPVETFTYDAVGNLVARSDRSGKVTDFVFDSLNRVVTETAPAATGGQPRPVTRRKYDPAGNAVRVEQPSGAVMELAYDKLGRVRTQAEHVRHSSGTSLFTTTFDHDGAGNVIYRQAPNGDTQTWLYARTGELLQHLDALGKATTYTYDVGGRLLTKTDPQGRSLRHTYDAAGRQVTTAQHDAGGVAVLSESYTYDALGRRTAATDPAGVTTTFGYDGLGRLTGVHQPVAVGQPDVVTSFGYDARGSMTRVTDGNGQVWFTTYNTWGLVESRIEPATTAHPALADRTFTVSYDASGRPATEQLPGGVTVTRTYDDLGRLTGESGGSVGGSRSMGYDLVGRLVSFSHPAGTVDVDYDDRNQVVSVAGPAGASSFVYDAKGRMTERHDAAGVTGYGWSSRDEVTGLSDPVTGDLRSYAWSDAGDLEAVDYGNGVDRDYVWDGIGRLAADTLTEGSNTLWSASYSYDTAGRLATETVGPAGVAGAGTNTYGYDLAGRVTSWDGPGSEGPTTYTWDANGNRLTAGSMSFAYDQRNRVLTEGNKALLWSARGTLAGVIENSTTKVFDFDGLGNMVEADGVAYSYDALGRVANRQASAFTYSGLGAQPTGDATTFVARSPDGSPVAAGDGAAQVHLLADRHGDVIGSFDDSGLVDSIAYDPFGEVLDRLGVSELMVGFQGHYTDPTTGLVDMGARWYQPSTGGFTSRDTYDGIAATPVSLNRYTYAHNNPLDFFDPDGHAPALLDSGYSATSAKWSQNAAKKSNPKPKFTPRLSADALDRQTAAATPTFTPRLSADALDRQTTPTSSPASVKTSHPKLQLATATTTPVPVAAPVTSDFANLQVGTPSGWRAQDHQSASAVLTGWLFDPAASPRQTAAAVRHTTLGQMVASTIDVAHQSNWSKADGNWSTKDINAAAAGTGVTALLVESGAAPGAYVPMIADLVQSVASRLQGHEQIWESLDTDKTWWDRHGRTITSIATNIAIGAVAVAVAGFACGATALATAGLGCVVAAGIAGGALAGAVAYLADAGLTDRDASVGGFNAAVLDGMIVGGVSAVPGYYMAAGTNPTALAMGVEQRSAVGAVGAAYRTGVPFGLAASQFEQRVAAAVTKEQLREIVP